MLNQLHMVWSSYSRSFFLRYAPLQNKFYSVKNIYGLMEGGSELDFSAWFI